MARGYHTATLVVKKGFGWGDARKNVRKLQPMIRLAVEGALYDAAEMFRNKLVRGIYSGALPTENQALSAKWKEEKAEKGHSPLTLVATGKYLDSIRIVKRRKTVTRGLQAEVWLGVDDPDSVEKAMTHEYGLGKNPERPHWRPTAIWFKRFGGNFLGEMLRKRLIAR